MTDIRTLLYEAAPAPSGPLDMTAVRSRSARRSWRRIAAWMGGVGLVIGAGVAGGGNLLVSTGSDGRDHPSHEREAAAEATTTTTTADGSSAGSPGAAAGAEGAVGGGPTAARASGPEVVSSRSTGTSTLDPWVYPSAESCSVDNTGMGDGQRRSCSFRATAKGGAQLRSSGPTNPSPGVSAEGTVTVTRDGQRTTYTIGKWRAEAGGMGVFIGCEVNIIQPGDLVDVELVNGTDADGETSVTTLGAGKDFNSC